MIAFVFLLSGVSAIQPTERASLRLAWHQNHSNHAIPPPEWKLQEAVDVSSFVSLFSHSSDGFFMALSELDRQQGAARHDAGNVPRIEDMSIGHFDWMLLFAFTVGAFLLDAFVLSRLVGTTAAHFAVLLLWALLSLLYNMMVISMHGTRMGVQWWTAYFFEWLLNVDNLFVFIGVFGVFHTPATLRPKAMLCWMPFAIALRITLSALMKDGFEFWGLIKVWCGFLLIYTGYDALRGNDGDAAFDVDSLKSVKCFRWLLGEHGVSEYDEVNKGMFLEKSGKLRATMLVLVVFTLSIVDVFFVFDSIAAKLPQIPSQYIATSAEVVSLFGMRSFIVVLEDGVETFALLKYGICIVLAFLGAQLVLGGVLPGQFVVTPMQSAQIGCTILLMSVVASKVKDRIGGDRQKDIRIEIANHVGDH